MFWKVNGRENIDTSRSHVLISNHRSILDIPLNAAAYPTLYRFLAKEEAKNIPLFGALLYYVAVAVDRSSPESRKKSFERMRQAMDDGYDIFIYPEGTRNRTKEPLTKFYDGAFRLAIDNQAPMLVTTVVGTDVLSSPFRKVDARPGFMHVYHDGPIETTGMTRDDMDALKLQARELMLARLKQHGIQ